jgi:GNAT superfamily N-acetyltransferase
MKARLNITMDERLNMNNVVIKEYNNQHKKDVQKLILEIQQKEFHIDIDIERQPDLLDIPNFYKKNNGNFWIAEMGHSIIGTISLLDIGNNQAALRKMFVDKNYRGKEYGVGQKLLHTLLAWAKTNGVKEIFLGTTEKFLAAHRFYEKNGFEEINKNDLPEKFPIMPVDVKFYKYQH